MTITREHLMAAGLSEQHAIVIEARFCQEVPVSRAALARQLETTPAQVRKLESHALRRLRHPDVRPRLHEQRVWEKDSRLAKVVYGPTLSEGAWEQDRRQAGHA